MQYKFVQVRKSSAITAYEMKINFSLDCAHTVAGTIIDGNPFTNIDPSRNCHVSAAALRRRTRGITLHKVVESNASEKRRNPILMGVTMESTVLLSIALRAVPGKSTAISFIFRRYAAAPRANKVLLMSSRHSYLTAS